MKLLIFISLFIFVTVCCLPAVFTDPRDGNRAIAAIITLQMPPKIRAGARVENKCDKPRETPEITGCVATSGEFPASKITCQCTSCSLMLKLTCFPDGNWYPTETNVCSSKNPATKCGLCKAESRPKNMKCVEDPLNGFLGEERHCLCKLDCLEITIKCGNDGLWYNSNNELCEDTLTPVTYLHDEIQNVTFYRGNYTFACPPGYKLDGPNTATCKNGHLDTARFPECIIDVKTTTSTTKQTTVFTTTTSTPKPQNMMKTKETRDYKLIYIVIGGTILIIIVIVTFIVACVCIHRRKQKMKEEMLRNNPIFKLEELTNVKGFMIVNDMYKRDNKNLVINPNDNK